jgi:hypothetical protein
MVRPPIPRAKGKKVTLPNAYSMELVKRLIAKTALASMADMRELAASLRRPTVDETLRAVHAWIQANIKYTLDDENREQIRTAARSWADRKIGVDCEDYSILTTAILGAMGLGKMAKMAIVGFAGTKGYQHIYPIYTQQAPGSHDGRIDGVALDRLLNFNEHPQNIVRTMVIDLLSGLSAQDQKIGRWLHELPPNARLVAAEAAPYIQDITPMGAIVWRDSAPMTAINAMVEQVERGDLSGLNAYRRANKSKKGDKRKPVSALLRITPSMVAGRAAFLLAVSQNLFKLASRFDVAMMTSEQAKAKGYDLGEHARWAARLPKLKKRWENFGGEWSKLESAILKGRGKGKGLGFDPTVLAVGTAAAAPIIAAIVPLMGDVDFKKMTAKTDDPIGSAGEMGKAASSGIEALRGAAKRRKDKKAQQAELEALDAAAALAKDGDGADPSPSREPTEEKKGISTGLIIGGLVLVGGIALVASSGGGDKK